MITLTSLERRLSRSSHRRRTGFPLHSTSTFNSTRTRRRSFHASPNRSSSYFSFVHTMSSAVRDPLEGDIPYVEGEQIEEDEEEEDEDVPIGAYEDEIYGKSSILHSNPTSTSTRQRALLTLPSVRASRIRITLRKRHRVSHLDLVVLQPPGSRILCRSRRRLYRGRFQPYRPKRSRPLLQGSSRDDS